MTSFSEADIIKNIVSEKRYENLISQERRYIALCPMHTSRTSPPTNTKNLLDSL